MANTAAPSTLKSEFINESEGQAGAILLDQENKPRAVSVKPGEKVYMSQEEQALTANAPQNPEDNPFTNGTFKLLTKASEIVNRRPIGDPTLGASPAQDEEAQRKAEERKQAERQRAEAVRKRQAEAQKAAQETGSPAARRPPARSEGEGAVEAPQREETAARPQPAQTQGQRSSGEETGTSGAREASDGDS